MPNFLNLMFRYNMIPLRNKPIQVTRHSTNAIDHIITNSVVDHNNFKSVIIKTDLSDHFSIVFAIKTNETTQRPVVKSTYKRSYCEQNIDKFKSTLHSRNWDNIKKIEDTNKAYKYFLKIFIDMTIGFKNRNLKLNSRVIRTLGLLTVLQNHQKRNNRTPKNEDTYKIYKTLFETIKKRSKKKFYSEKLQKFNGDAKKNMKCYERDTWKVHHKIFNSSN